MLGQLRDLQARLRTWLGGVKGTYFERDPEDIEFDRVRRDIDAVMSDMQLITQSSAGQSALLRERLRLLGLDQAYVETVQKSAFEDLQVTCRVCDSQRRCARDLARGDVAVGMERYCQNAKSLDALLVERFRG